MTDTAAFSRVKLLRTYVAGVAVGAIAALASAAAATPPTMSTELGNGLLAVIGIALAAELSSVSLHVGTVTMSISFIPFVAAILLFDPMWAMMIGGGTLFVVDLMARHKPWIKIILNSSKEVISIGLAALVYGALGGKPSVAEPNLSAAAVLGAGVAYFASSSVSVCIAVSLAERLPFRDAWARLVGGSVVYDVFALPLPALLAYVYGRWELPGMVAVVVPLFIVRHIYAMNLRLEQANRELLEVMVKNIEARDPYTSGHSQRVSRYARIIAKEFGLSSRQIEQIATAALLHDVGKVHSEFASLLQKDAKLTHDETQLLRSHPVRSADLVRTISSLRGAVESAVRHHHENFDGSGYPDGMSGEQIPLGARIIMIADTLDAMTTDRPYRKALSFERVVEELRRLSGRQFDPQLAEIAIGSSAIQRLIAGASQYVAPFAVQRPSLVREERARA
ncbi:MAG: HD-GYP domain-containing protein [Burkholderiales bacterium]